MRMTEPDWAGGIVPLQAEIRRLQSRAEDADTLRQQLDLAVEENAVLRDQLKDFHRRAQKAEARQSSAAGPRRDSSARGVAARGDDDDSPALTAEAERDTLRQQIQTLTRERKAYQQEANIQNTRNRELDAAHKRLKAEHSTLRQQLASRHFVCEAHQPTHPQDETVCPCCEAIQADDRATDLAAQLATAVQERDAANGIVTRLAAMRPVRYLFTQSKGPWCPEDEKVRWSECTMCSVQFPEAEPHPANDCLWQQAQLAALQGVSGWQPIETAPKGQRSILRRDNGFITVGDWGKFYVYNDPKYTHWMPLPSPPALQGVAAETTKPPDPTLFGKMGGERVDPGGHAGGARVTDEIS